jgi:hypothetical protein
VSALPLHIVRKWYNSSSDFKLTQTIQIYSNANKLQAYIKSTPTKQTPSKNIVCVLLTSICIVLYSI